MRHQVGRLDVPLKESVRSSREILSVMDAGSHGSTIGGNPLACAIGREVIALLRDGTLIHRASVLGDRMLRRLRAGCGDGIAAVRGRGLWAGADVSAAVPSVQAVCEALLPRGVLAKGAHERTIRIAPPLIVDEGDLDRAVDEVIETCNALADKGA